LTLTNAVTGTECDENVTSNEYECEVCHARADMYHANIAINFSAYVAICRLILTQYNIM